MNSKRKRTLTLQLGLTTLACACLIACGGGGSPAATTGDNNSSNSSSSNTAQSQLTGTAAYGAPMAGASITLIDAAGTQKTTTANSDGSYTLDVTGLTAPFLIKASMTSGDSVKEYSSLVMTAPKAGDTPGVANVTPLTHALVSMVSSDGANPNEFADVSKLKNVDPAKLAAALTNLQAALVDVLSAANLPANFDPMTASFKADRSSDADVLLDTIKVAVSDQGVSLTNARVPASETGSNTDSATITLKGTTAPKKALAPPTVKKEDLKGLDAFQAEANACLALAPGSRVKESNNSYEFLGACANVTGFDTANYKGNGYSLQRLWGYRLLKEIPEGSKLLTPEFLLFLDSGNKAIVRLASASPSGGKVYVETAAKTATGWQIIGNQRDYDAGINVRLYRQNDLSTNGWTIPTNYTGSNDKGKNVGKFDAYTSRLTFSFNQSGPNGSDVYAVRIKGPGLPDSGIVLSRSSVCGSNDYLAFYSNNGSLPSLAANSPSLPTSSSATNSWILDVANFGSAYKGTDFFNQYRGLNSNSSGSLIGGPSDSIDNNTTLEKDVLSKIPEFAVYNWEVFTYAGDPLNPAKFSSRIITRPLAASEGGKQPWAALNQDALDYLDPKNTAKAAELVDGKFSWTLPNTTAPIVVNGYIYGKGTLGRMNMGQAVAKPGDTTLNLTASVEKNGNGVTCNYAKVPTFTSTSGYREVGVRQVTDRGSMLQQYSFHTGRAAP